MNDKGIRVLEQYDMEVKKVQKSRGFMLVESDKGYFRLVEYKGSSKRLVYANELLEYLKNNGFTCVDSIWKNKTEALFSTDVSGERYILTNYFHGAECDMRNKQDLVRSVKTLARLHNILEKPIFTESDYIPIIKDSMEELLRHNAELRRIRTFIRKKSKKTEFEYQILENFEQFYQIALDVTEKLEASSYQSLYRQALENGSISHGNFNYHNLIQCEQGQAVINFEHSGIGLLIKDLYFFMRKAMEKHDWNPYIGFMILDAYQSIRTLSKEEIDILKILLQYPEKFWKILNHYFNGNKSYLSDQTKEKLGKVYEQQKKKNYFMEQM